MRTVCIGESAVGLYVLLGLSMGLIAKHLLLSVHALILFVALSYHM